MLINCALQPLQIGRRKTNLHVIPPFLLAFIHGSIY